MGFYEQHGKRALDAALSSAGLLILSPLLAVLGLRVKIEDGGTVFYRGTRVGRGGSTFRIFKFRTMVMNAESIGGPSTSADDSRITRTGRTLRKYKLDELPQLLNVLKGDMSLVGPRPEVPSEVETYSADERRVLTVRPGITDWASIEFRNEGEILQGSADPHLTYREKIRPGKLRLALAYVDNISLRTDLEILARTVKAVLAD